ncbi:MAG: hypothetical protein V1872_06655 [bacterium]
MKKLSKTNKFLGTTNLYSFDDHLLLEKNIGYTSEYRRFFYDDIISIITYKNPFWVIQIILLLIITGISLFLIFTNSSSSRIVPVIISITVSPFWLFAFFHLFLGPTSKAQIRTTTSTEKIVLANRYKKSKKILQEIQHLIELQQGVVDPNTLGDKPLAYNPPLSAEENIRIKG